MRGKLLNAVAALGVAVAVGLFYASGTRAGTIRDSRDLAPTGKGWGEQRTHLSSTVVTGNGINYHGGPIMPSVPNVYFIWYGNWTKGARASDSPTTVNLLGELFAPEALNSSGVLAPAGIGGSGYDLINTTYSDYNNQVQGIVGLAKSTTDNYSQGTRLSDSAVQAIVASAIKAGLPSDTNGIYFVLTSSDVAEKSGFCTRYCGWHTHGSINGVDIKYSFVGNPDRCPSACEWQTNSPNGDSGADGMASVMAHESEEMLTDPDLNAWYDSGGAENADKCAWKFGPTQTTGSGALYNQTFNNGTNWLIQMNWENNRGGGCDQTLGGAFYTK